MSTVGRYHQSMYPTTLHDSSVALGPNRTENSLPIVPDVVRPLHNLTTGSSELGAARISAFDQQVRDFEFRALAAHMNDGFSAIYGRYQLLLTSEDTEGDQPCEDYSYVAEATMAAQSAPPFKISAEAKGSYETLGVYFSPIDMDNDQD